MKKILSIVLVAVLALSMLSSCTIGNKVESTESTNTTGTEAQTTGPANTESDTVEMYKPPFAENADEKSVYTANYAFSNAQIGYIIQSSYQNLIYNLQYYGVDLTEYGIDITKSLKDQEYKFDDSIDTWFDYYLESSLATAKEILAICEAANAAGYTLPKEAEDEIGKTIDSYKKYAEEANMSLEEYFAENLGENITVEVLNGALELSYLAQYYINDCIEKLDLSDAVLEAKYQEDTKSADTVDYLIIALDHSELIPEDADDADIEEAKNTCRAAASEIVKATDADAFKAAASKCLVDHFGYEKEDADNEVETLEYTDNAYSEDPVLDWLFSAEAGEAGVIEDEQYGIVYAVMLLKRNARDTEASKRSVRHILFTNDTYKDDTVVNQVYNEWVDGGATVEDFTELAKEYSEDPGSADNGGLYEDVSEGEMVDEFNDWLFDPARVVGDHAIVKSASYGWHIMYYEGAGEPAWKETVRTYIKNETSAKIVSDAKATYEITVDEELLKDIPA